MKFKCPNCMALFEVSGDLAGTRAKCPKCRLQFIVPKGSADSDKVRWAKSTEKVFSRGTVYRLVGIGVLAILLAAASWFLVHPMVTGMVVGEPYHKLKHAGPSLGRQLMLVVDYLENPRYLSFLGGATDGDHAVQKRDFPIRDSVPKPLKEGDGRKLLERLRGRMWEAASLANLAAGDIPEGKVAVTTANYEQCARILDAGEVYFRLVSNSVPEGEVRSEDLRSPKQLAEAADALKSAYDGASVTVMGLTLVIMAALAAVIMLIGWAATKPRT